MRRLYLHLSIVVMMFSLVCLSASKLRAEFVSVPPPPLPIYDQPAIPGPGYVWVPGSWAYDDASGYYWVPGTWVIPPKPGLLWTPTYWSYNRELNAYGFHQGYWAEEVGFYGGIAYGFGYPGTGYAGGYWRGEKFFYNQVVNNLAGAPIADVFSQPVDVVASPVSFLGGPGGINIRITPQQAAVSKLPHESLTTDQKQQITAARGDSGSFEKNGGPKVGATKTAGKSHKDRSLNSEAKGRPRSGNQQVSNGGEIVKKGGNAAGTAAAGGQDKSKTGEAQKTPPVVAVRSAGGKENGKIGGAQKPPPGGAAGAAGVPETPKTAGKVVRPQPADKVVSPQIADKVVRPQPAGKVGRPPFFNNDARQSGKQIAPPSRVQSVRIAPPQSVRVAPARVTQVAAPRVNRVALPRVTRVAPPRINRVAPPRNVAPPRAARPRTVRPAPQRAVRVAPPRAVRAAPPRVNRAASRPQRRR